MYLINGVYVGPRDIADLSGGGVRRYARTWGCDYYQKNSARTQAKTMHHLCNEFSRKLATDLVSRNFTPGAKWGTLQKGRGWRNRGVGGLNTGAPLLDLCLPSLHRVTEPQALTFLHNDVVMLWIHKVTYQRSRAPGRLALPAALSATVLKCEWSATCWTFEDPIAKLCFCAWQTAQKTSQFKFQTRKERNTRKMWI